MLDNRNIRGIGIDTLSYDYGPSHNYPVHQLLLRDHGKWALENLNNLDKIPAVGGFMIVAPIKHQGGSGGFARVITYLY